MFQYGLLDENNNVVEIRKFQEELNPENIKKRDGLPILRELRSDLSVMEPHQVLRGYEYIVHDDYIQEQKIYEERVSDYKKLMLLKIDEDAEKTRLKYITNGSGQMLTYQAKAEEAKEYLADPSPDSQNYPLLSAEIGITGDTLSEIATIVRQQHAAFKQLGSAIEQIRLGKKAAVQASSTGQEITQLVSEIVWP